MSYDEATGLYSVVDKACTNGAHNYVLAEVYETAERDCVAGGIYYYRCECGAYVTDMYDAMGHSYTIISVEQEATQTSVGIKRVDCDRCDDYYTFEYAFSPADIEVTITVNTINGQKDITLLASDVFDFVITEGANYSCVINAIKDGDGYTKQDIVKLTIPSGLITVASEAISGLTSLKEIETMNYANVTFKCLYCDEISGTEETASFPVIFSFIGYSVPEDGELAITVGYSVDLEVLEEYEAVMGKLEFGVVAAVAERLNGKAPLDEANKSVIKAQIDGRYASFDLVIKDFNETQLDLALIMCAYVYDGTKYVYLQDMQVDSPVPVSINSVMNRK